MSTGFDGTTVVESINVMWDGSVGGYESTI